MQRSQLNRERTQIILRMSFYVVIFILCWSGPLAHRVAQYGMSLFFICIFSNFFFPYVILIITYLVSPNESGTVGEFLKYWDAVGSSIQGFMNALVWLSSPSIFKSFKKNVLMRLDCAKLFIKTEDSAIPLLGENINDLLEGYDVQKFDSLLRKNIITYLLYGMKESVSNLSFLFAFIRCLKQELYRLRL